MDRFGNDFSGSTEPNFEFYTNLESGEQDNSIEVHNVFLPVPNSGIPVPDRYHRKVSVLEDLHKKFQANISKEGEMTGGYFTGTVISVYRYRTGSEPYHWNEYQFFNELSILIHEN